jgi:hypothetical protein
MSRRVTDELVSNYRLFVDMCSVEKRLAGRIDEHVARSVISTLNNFIADRAEDIKRIADLEKQVAGDTDHLMCKCGSEDCEAIIAKYDMDDCFWTDQKRIELSRAIILHQHKRIAELEAEVANLKLGIQEAAAEEILEQGLLRAEVERLQKGIKELVAEGEEHQMAHHELCGENVALEKEVKWLKEQVKWLEEHNGKE